MTKREIKRMIKEVLHADTVGTNKQGNVICRWGFFYSHGRTAERYTDAVSDLLDRNQVSYSIVESAQIWKAFRGGASTANQSHFRVEVQIN